MLDGFPRTLGQSAALEDRLVERGGRVRNAIYVEVPTRVLVERLAGRWICRSCQTTYHEEFNPPSSAGTCDRCSGELYQRPDDKREVVANRVDVYLRDTLPVVKGYERRGCCAVSTAIAQSPWCAPHCARRSASAQGVRA